MKLTLVALLLVAISPMAANAQNANQVITLTGFGQPLPGISGNTTDLQIFATGQLNFKEVDSLPALGPIFNSRSCRACHFQPAIGGPREVIPEGQARDITLGGARHILFSGNILPLRTQSRGAATIFAHRLDGAPVAR